MRPSRERRSVLGSLANKKTATDDNRIAFDARKMCILLCDRAISTASRGEREREKRANEGLPLENGAVDYLVINQPKRARCFPVSRSIESHPSVLELVSHNVQLRLCNFIAIPAYNGELIHTAIAARFLKPIRRYCDSFSGLSIQLSNTAR